MLYLLLPNLYKSMANVVGTGCMAASVIGAFSAVEEDRLEASVAGLVCYEVAAEMAAKTAKGPGSFKEDLFDASYNLDGKTVNRMQKIVEAKA